MPNAASLGGRDACRIFCWFLAAPLLQIQQSPHSILADAFRSFCPSPTFNCLLYVSLSLRPGGILPWLGAQGPPLAYGGKVRVRGRHRQAAGRIISPIATSPIPRVSGQELVTRCAATTDQRDKHRDECITAPHAGMAKTGRTPLRAAS